MALTRVLFLFKEGLVTVQRCRSMGMRRQYAADVLLIEYLSSLEIPTSHLEIREEHC